MQEWKDKDSEFSEKLQSLLEEGVRRTTHKKCAISDELSKEDRSEVVSELTGTDSLSEKSKLSTLKVIAPLIDSR